MLGKRSTIIGQRKHAVGTHNIHWIHARTLFTSPQKYVITKF